MSSEPVPENGRAGGARRRNAEKRERRGVERRGDDGRREKVQTVKLMKGYLAGNSDFKWGK